MDNVKQVLVAGRLHPAGRAVFDARADIRYEVLDDPSVADVEARIAALDGILVRKVRITAETVAMATRLAIVARHGVGYDNVDVDALTARGIPLTVVGEANSVPVAEQALTLMLAVSRKLLRADRAVRAAEDYAIREQLGQTELAGKTVLIVGMGRIGTRVARRCAAFDMNVVIADPYVPLRVVRGLGYRYVEDFHDALGEADIVTLHMPGRGDRAPVFAGPEFAAMKQGAYLVNCARGTLIDEDALFTALTDGPLAGAGLDVMRDEPPGKDHPLLWLDNVVFSPHAAASTVEAQARMAATAARNIVDALDGRLDRDMVVNPEVLG